MCVWCWWVIRFHSSRVRTTMDDILEHVFSMLPREQAALHSWLLDIFVTDRMCISFWSMVRTFLMLGCICISKCTCGWPRQAHLYCLNWGGPEGLIVVFSTCTHIIFRAVFVERINTFIVRHVFLPARTTNRKLRILLITFLRKSTIRQFMIT